MERFLPLLLGWLLLAIPALSLTAEQERLLGRVSEYYRFVDQPGLASWLEDQVGKGQVTFGTLSGKESATMAAVHMRTGVVTINEAMFTRDDFASLVDLGTTLAHERKHTTQSYLGWAVETYKQDLGYGNAYEREGWAEGLQVARETALKLRNDLSKARSAREREIAGQRLKIAVDSWQTLANGWKQESKVYGNFPANQFVDSDGLSISLEQMAAERTSLKKVALDAVVTSKASISTYDGRYIGQLSGGASGRFAFTVQPDYAVAGSISGSHQYGNFKGTLHGRVDTDGLVSGQVMGTVSKGSWSERFTGTFSGRISGGTASGDWTAGAEGVWPSGSWSVNRQ